MTDRQRDKLDAYDRVANFNTLNAAALAGIADYAAEQGFFDPARAAIAAAGNVQSTVVTGFADDSEASKIDMADVVIQYARAGLVKAKRANNMGLADALDFQVTYITTAPKLTAISRTQDIRDALNNNLAICTNVTAGNIATIDAAITDYSNKQSQPVSQLQTKKAAGTDLLHAQFEIADEAVQNMNDLVFSFLPALSDSFRLAKEIITTGHHYTGLDATITKGITAAIAQGVTVTIVELNRSAVSDINGVADIQKFKPGTYHLSLSGAGVVSQTVIAKIKRGQTLDLHFQMQTV